MCGIIGYVGKREIVNVILDGLERLAYRGYDSAGLAVAGGGDGLQIRRAEGKLKNLQAMVNSNPLAGTYGIGHSRWATHGRPNEQNAHPHQDCTHSIVLVHNGIIENYSELKQELVRGGHAFSSDTDTEVLAHLIEVEHIPGRSLEVAVRRALRRIQGVFAIAVLAVSEPNKIVVSRTGPPAVIGLGEGEVFVASDIPAILHRTRQILFLEDGDLAVLTPAGATIFDAHGSEVRRHVQEIEWDPRLAEKAGYPHFMLKEIHEQPRAVADTLRSRIDLLNGRVILEDIGITEKAICDARRLQILACGTSWHAGLAGKYMIERLARLPVDVDYSSEYRYRDCICDPQTLTLSISQSGETADTLAAQREAASRGLPTLAMCNVVGSTMTREAAGTLYTRAGPEIGVASTKAFSAQLTAMLLLAVHFARVRGTLGSREATTLLDGLLDIPRQLREALALKPQCLDLAIANRNIKDYLFLGRGIHFPIALEGALKLKEISYLHAEGYAAGEMKHGPNALIDENLTSIILCTGDLQDEGSRVRYEKTLSNLQEVKARSGRVLAIACRGDERIAQLADQVLFIPKTAELLLPFLEIVPLQLFAYSMAVLHGCDVDQPRNLAKSVTVE